MSPDGRMLIAGRRRAGRGPPLSLQDPSTGRHLAEVGEADAEEVAVAVGVARAAADGGEWSRVGAADRARLLRRCADALDGAAHDLARVQAMEMGRPVTRGREADAPQAASAFRYYAGLIGDLGPERRATGHADARLVVESRPAGVVAALTPWNMPLLLASWALAPALAAGCPVVVKPSETAPLAVLALCERLLDAGLPPGAVSVVTGRGETTGAALVAHPEVDVVAFTGSVTAGRHVAARAGARGARVSLELGGKNALIVCADADPDVAAQGAALAAFANAGQACSAGSRILVARSLADRFTERLVAAAETLVPGPALHPATRLGPLATAAHRDRVLGHIAHALADGARPLTSADPPAHLADGWYVAPSVLAAVPADAPCLREEIFGPVVTVEAVDDPDEAVALANDTPYGLAAGIFTTDPATAERVAGMLRAGTIWVNCWHRYDPAAPFGGLRASGFGRTGGPESLGRFIDPVSVWTVSA